MPSKPTDTAITISAISKPPTESEIDLYTEIRLAALFTNPEAFGSTYAREAAFPRSTRHERLSTPGITTFYASVDSPGSFAASDPGGPPDDPESSPTAKTTLAPWLATLSLISPSRLTAYRASDPEPPFPPLPAEINKAEEEGRAEVWNLTGMWVRPEWRGKGVGRILVSRAVEGVKNGEGEDEEGEKETTGGKKRSKDRAIFLRVQDDNMAAQKLYESVGFKMYPDPEDKIAVEVKAIFAQETGRQRWSWMGLTIPAEE